MNNTFKIGATYSAYQKISRLAIANGHSPLQYDNLVYVGFYNCGDIIKHEFKHNGVFVWFEDGLVNNDKSEDNSMTIASAPTNRKAMEQKYYVVDGFVWQIVRHDEVFDLYRMNKEVFELHDDGSESLLVLEDMTNIDASSVYGIEVGHLDELNNNLIIE